MVRVDDIVKKLNLEVLVPTTKKRMEIESSDINRPGLQFTGFWEYFAFERMQVLGKVEMSYLDMLEPERRMEQLDIFFSLNIPCVVLCRGFRCPDDMVQCALKYDVPVFGSDLWTTKFVLTAINYLNAYLAPRITSHGVLMDVYGVGILITGESGAGKSESALELVKRGHRLVADDVVDIKRVADNRLIGESPEMVRHFMEIRGIGIIDISAMYGIGAVIATKSIDMVIHLEHWRQDKEYDRLGLTETYTAILDVNLPYIELPIRPGRNIAIVLEVAARNYRLKLEGFNAAKELDKRLSDRIARANLGIEEDED